MRLYLDSNAIIYLIEGAPPFRDKVLKRVLEVEAVPGGELVTSRLARLECRTKPLRDGDSAVLERYDEFFALPRLVTIDVSGDVIELATAVRVKHRLHTPDALHVASAVRAGADVLLTGDAKFSRVNEVRVEILEA